METAEGHTVTIVGPMAMGKHSLDRVRIPGNGDQDDMHPLRFQTPGVGASRVDTMPCVAGSFSEGVLCGMGSHSPKVGGVKQQRKTSTTQLGYVYQPGGQMSSHWDNATDGGQIPVRGAHYGAAIVGKSAHARCGRCWSGATTQTTTHIGFPVGNSPEKTDSPAEDK